MTEAIAEAIAAEVSEQVAEVQAAEATAEAAEALTEAAEAITEAAEAIAEAADEVAEAEPIAEAEAPIITILNRNTELLTEILTRLDLAESNESEEIEPLDLEAPVEIVLPIEAEPIAEQEQTSQSSNWLTNLLFG